MQEITSLYIHFPFCIHLCNYCDFYKKKLESSSQIDSFEKLLKEQIDFHKKFLLKNNAVMGELETLYLGGGTPSLWKNKGILFLKKMMEQNDLKLSSQTEFTLEVDPGTWTESEVDEWIKIGVNRFSIGSQAFSEKFISIMDRHHNFSDVIKTVKFFSEKNLNFSVDLMIGVPFSHERNLEAELEGLLKYEPKHLSLYILKARKNYGLYDKIPDDQLIREEYLFVSNYLTNRGYDHYEVSNFSKDEFKSRHNLKYWSYNSVAAIGPNATGLLVNEKKGLRYQWKSIGLGVTQEEISGESLLIEKIFLGLRCSFGFNLKEILGGGVSEKDLALLYESWKQSDYLMKKSTKEKMFLTPLGYLMSDCLMDDIFKKASF